MATPRGEDGRLDVAACLTFLRYIEGEALKPSQMRNLARFLQRRYGMYDEAIVYRWFPCAVRLPVGARIQLYPENSPEVFASFSEGLHSARHAGMGHHLDMGRRDTPSAVGKAVVRPLATHANLLDLIEHCAQLAEDGKLRGYFITRPERIRFSARRLAREAELFVETTGGIEVEVCKTWPCLANGVKDDDTEI